jgi:hypothetical protein
MKLDSLPNELISHIFSYLNNETTKRDLLAISICCRLFKSLAEPRLYSSFPEPKSKAQLTISLFLHQVRLRPHIAQYVEKYGGQALWDVEFEHGYVRRFDFGDIHLIPSTIEKQSTKQWVKQVLRNKGFASLLCNRWSMAIFKAKNWGAVVAFMLLLLPNIKNLRLKYGWHNINLVTPNYSYLTEILSKMEQRQLETNAEYKLPVLREVYLKAGPTGCLVAPGLTFDLVAPYLRQSSLLKFEAHHVFLDSVIPEQIFHATSVTLSYSHLSSDALRSFLRCFRSLRKLDYEETGIDEGDEVPLPESLMEGLQNSQYCLEELSLRITDPNWVSGALPRRLGSVAHFGKLR